MKIKMNDTVSHKTGVYAKNSEVEVDDKFGSELIAGDLATEVKAEKKSILDEVREDVIEVEKVETTQHGDKVKTFDPGEKKIVKGK